jgi:hypothetical protein
MGIIKIALVDEDGHDEAEVSGDPHLLDPLLPKYQGERYHCLRFIDLYGDTVFNNPQMKQLAVEWDDLEQPATDAPTRSLLQQVRDLIRVGSSQYHLYLKFFGD